MKMFNKSITLSLNEIKKRLTPGTVDRWGEGLESWLITELTLKAFKQKPLYNREANGFLQCSEEEMLSSFGLSSSLFLDREFTKLYYTDDAFFSVEFSDNGLVSIFLLTTSFEMVKKLEEFKKTLKAKKDNIVNVLTQGQHGIEITPLASMDAPIIRENYTNEIMNKYDLLVKELQYEEPHGRLVIINGPPGSGKTFLIRGLIKQLMKSTVLILPANLVSGMDGPQLLTTFISHKRHHKRPMTVIIEDADSCLVPRMGDNMSAISSLLNCADGIMGSVLDLRIVATTNQEKLQFDKALTRNGRMLQHLNIAELSMTQANEVYKRLTETNISVFTEPQLLADIYAIAKDKMNNARELIIERAIGFGGCDSKKLMRK